MENQIVITKYNNVDSVDSRLIANELGIQHKNLLELVKKYQSKIESRFGLLAFETLNVKVAIPNTNSHRIDESTIIHFNENQSLFITTLSRNSEQSIELKARLVEAFSKARAALVELMKPKELTKRGILLLALESEERALAAESKVLELQPKVEAFDRVIDNSTTYTLDTVSDIINVGRNKLSEKLKQIGWAVRDSSKGTSSTRKVEEIGYTRTFFETIKKGNQEIKVKKIVVTKKGLDYLVNNYSKIFA